MKVDNYYSTDKLRSEFACDSVVEILRKAACKFSYKGLYDLGPPGLNAMFELHVNEWELRPNEQLNAIVPRCKTQFGENNFAVRATLYWNQLPLGLKNATSPESFKSALKGIHITV